MPGTRAQDQRAGTPGDGTALRGPAGERAWIAGAAILLALGYASRLRFGYEWDELQFLHAGWSIATGLAPYRDFFEHHPPLFFHLLSPFLAGQATADQGLLVAIRSAALAVLVAIVGLHHRVLRELASAWAARFGAIALLVVIPFSGKLFELRPDWLALLALLLAVLPWVRALRAGAAPSSGPALFSGVLIGLAVCLTQKALPLGLAMLAWLLLDALVDRRQPVRPLLACVGAALPLLTLGRLYAPSGDVALLFEHVITINLAWPQELPASRFWNQNGGASFGFVVLTWASVVRVALATVRVGWQRTPESFLAAIATAGMISYFATPVPWEQSLLFFVAPWAVLLSVPALERYTAAPERVREDGFALATGVAIAMASLSGVRVIGVPLLWLAIAWWVRRRSRAPGASPLPRLAYTALLAPGLLIFTGDRIHDAVQDRGGRQAEFRRVVESHLPAGEPLLTMWEHVVPFRSSPSYYWFAHEGVLKRFAGASEASHAEALDREYAEAVDAGRVPVVLVHTAWLERYLPRLRESLERRCRRFTPSHEESDAHFCGDPGIAEIAGEPVSPDPWEGG